MTEKPKNARGLFDGLPKLDLGRVERPNLEAILEQVGEIDPPEDKKKVRPGEAAGLEGVATFHAEPAKRRTFYDLATSRRAVSAIGRLPGLDESFHVIMGGDYHGFDLVIAVRELARAPIDELHVATLGFNRHNIAHLCGMLDAGDVGRASIICADYFAKADPETFNSARADLKRRRHRLTATRNHSKILLFAIGENRFAVESSANLRSCNNLEQFALTNSPSLYAFHRTWLERVHEVHNGG